MKCWFRLCLVAVLTGGMVVSGSAQSTSTSVQPSSPPPPDNASVAKKSDYLYFSPLSREILQLSNSSVEEKVILTYIQNSTTPFSLNADQIAYLKNNGVSDAVLTAMLAHDQDVKKHYTEQEATVPPAEPNPDVDEAPDAEALPPDQPQGNQPIVEQAAPPSEADVTYFRDSLAPYGSWRYIDNYGWGWQPYVVARYSDWTPYCDDGRWLYSNQGWYWNSDYSWGWAPFHYGRWWRDPRLGWTWFPGRTWAPSWVMWRYSDPYCGWAPLPPGGFFNNGVGVGFNFGLSSDFFTFVTFGNFLDRDLRHHRLHHDQVNNFFGNTTVINNFARGRNNTAFNRGLDPRRVAAATGQPITPVQVRTLPNGNRSVRPDRVVRFGSTPTVFRPQLSTLAGTGINQLVNNQILRTPRLATTASPAVNLAQPPNASPPATTGNLPPVTTGAPAVGNAILRSTAPAVSRTLPPLAPATPALRQPLSVPRFTTGAFPTTPSTVNRANKSTAGLPFRTAPAVVKTFPLANGTAQSAPQPQAPVVPQTSSPIIVNSPRSIQSFAPTQPAVVPRVDSPGIIQQRLVPSFK